MRFSSKARTLLELQATIKSAAIAPLVYFTVSDWKLNPNACLSIISETIKADSFIVRSSSLAEDGVAKSNAGAFLSILHVKKHDIYSAINQVIDSYGMSSDNDEVLIQPMLENVKISGVAFPHDPHTSSPYRIINWNEGFDTTSVTSGLGGRVWQQAASSNKNAPGHLGKVIELVNELLEVFANSPVDCEFAITEVSDNITLWLLQARPLILKKSPEKESEQEKKLQNIHSKISRSMKPSPFIMGTRTVYGVMPDWNPAEIIGIRPKPLALSLYRELVTDSIWAYQRHNYGYRNLRSYPLMQSFYGQPYIDVRLSFNSFIPASLEDNLANRLVDYYIDRLLDEPALHDKVEFEIVYSCYTLDLPSREGLNKSAFG